MATLSLAYERSLVSLRGKRGGPLPFDGILYRREDDGIIVVRVLHDRMLPGLHLLDGDEE
jgi:hypothetical protein